MNKLAIFIVLALTITIGSTTRLRARARQCSNSVPSVPLPQQSSPPSLQGPPTTVSVSVPLGSVPTFCQSVVQAASPVAPTIVTTIATATISVSFVTVSIPASQITSSSAETHWTAVWALKSAQYKYYRQTPTGPYTWVRDSIHKAEFTEVVTPVHESYSYDRVVYGSTVYPPSSWSSPYFIAQSAISSVPSSKYITVYNDYALVKKSQVPSSQQWQGYSVYSWYQYYSHFSYVPTTYSYTWDEFKTWNQIGSFDYDTWTYRQVDLTTVSSIYTYQYWSLQNPRSTYDTYYDYESTNELVE